MLHHIAFEISIHGPNEFLHVGPLDNRLSDRNPLKGCHRCGDGCFLTLLLMSDENVLLYANVLALQASVDHRNNLRWRTWGLSGWKAAPSHALVTSVFKPSALQSLIFLLFSFFRIAHSLKCSLCEGSRASTIWLSVHQCWRHLRPDESTGTDLHANFRTLVRSRGDKRR